MIRIGTRGSALALAQARIVADALATETEIVVVRTAGDVTSRPISELGDGAFVVALQAALARGDVDVAVHSLKDLPTSERADLSIAAIPPREDPRDVLITATRGGLDSLPHGARVGTSSPRRTALLRAARPDLRFTDIRGNVDTRMRKVRTGEVAATVLALAGLRRLGVEVAEIEVLSTEVMLPAPGQGALAVECRARDDAIRDALAKLDDPPSRIAVEIERALLRDLGASCALALGALATVDRGCIQLDAALATEAGISRVRVTRSDPTLVVREAAARLRLVAHAV
jgi:hydroxymethylbilane synthase